MSHRSFALGVAALLGIAFTALITWGASQLASQRIGLAAEPLAVASGLAPAPSAPRPRSQAAPRVVKTHFHPSRPATPTQASPVQSVPVPAAASPPAPIHAPASSGSGTPMPAPTAPAVAVTHQTTAPQAPTRTSASQPHSSTSGGRDDNRFGSSGSGSDNSSGRGSGSSTTKAGGTHHDD